MSVNKPTTPAIPNTANNQTLAHNMQTAVHAVQIVNQGNAITLPVDMSVDAAIETLIRRKAFLDEDTVVREKFDVFPWDGAVALDTVLTNRYGWVAAEATPGFFGPTPPQILTVDIDHDQKRKVPWGRMSIPGITGFIQCTADTIDGRICFELVASVKRRDEPTIEGLFQDLRAYIASNSIYRGKAFKIRFYNDAGDKLEMPEPKFLNVADVDENHLIYSDDVMAAVRTNLFTPIERVKDCAANGIPFKRGVLLGGTFGTGKTLCAKVAAKKAVTQGITYLYVTRADELAEAIAFAKQYNNPGCVIFCEDIDREMNGERTEKMDDILNIIDGIDTKSSNIMVILTTNNLEGINPAMLRPGRLDAVIDVLPPDAVAVGKLLRLYGGTAIDADEDLTQVGELLNGRIPAVIAEVVKRAKLSQLSLQPAGVPVTKISSMALAEAAKTMQSQLDLLYREAAEKPRSIEDSLHDIMQRAVEGSPVSKHAKQVHEAVVRH
jgi:transitional endoplasmic reticulum ATPase